MLDSKRQRANADPVPAEEGALSVKRQALGDSSTASGHITSLSSGHTSSTPGSSLCSPTSGSTVPQAPPLKLVRCIVRKAGYLTYHPMTKPHCVHFCKFVEKSSEEEIAGYFREVMQDLAAKDIKDFQIQIVGSSHSGPSGFFAEVTHGQTFDGPPEIPLDKCIACQPEAELFPGMTSQELYLPEYDSLHMKVSLDAQGRPAYIITPLRHTEGLSDLQDNELVDLFRTTAKIMRREKLHFSRMVLNHGHYRNLPHLHLKIFIDHLAFEKSMKSWSDQRKGLWRKLSELKPAKSASICKFYKIHGRCKYGAQCRYQHASPPDAS